MERIFICQYEPKLGPFSEKDIKENGCPKCKSKMKLHTDFPQLRQSQMKGGNSKIVDDSIVIYNCTNLKCGFILSLKK